MVDGKLVEVLHVDEAKRTLALRRNIEALQVRALFLCCHSMCNVCGLQMGLDLTWGVGPARVCESAPRKRTTRTPIFTPGGLPSQARGRAAAK